MIQKTLIQTRWFAALDIPLSNERKICNYLRHTLLAFSSTLYFCDTASVPDQANVTLLFVAALH